MDIVFTRNELRTAGYVVYLAGIEVPVVSVRRDWNIGQHPTLSIDMVPDKTLRSIGKEDRLPVAVFYLDRHFDKTHKFCLYFDGYVVERSYEKTEASAVIRLNCVAHTKVFADLYGQYMTDFNSQLVGTLTPDPAAIPFPHSGLTFPASLLYSGLNPTKNAKSIRRPYDILENVLRACGGIDEIQSLGAPLSSSFFLRYMRRFNFFNRTLPSPLLETDETYMADGIFPILTAIRAHQSIATMHQRLASIGEGISLWDTIQLLYNQMLYETLVIPSAPIAQVNLKPASLRGEVLGPPKWNMSDTAKADVVSGKATGNPFSVSAKVYPDPTKPNRLINCVTKPQAIFGVPPHCNVIFPSMIRSHVYSDNEEMKPTRIYVGDMQTPQLFNFFGILAELSRIRTGYPAEVKDAMAKWAGSKTQQGNSFLSNKNFLIWPGEYFSGPRVIEEPLPEWFPYIDDILRYSDNTEIAEQARRDMSAVYAHYEFVRRRGTAGRGGVTLDFDPYIVPGFSTMILDDLDTGIVQHAYVVSVSDVLSERAMQTSITYAFAQTLDEFLTALYEARSGNNEVETAYPDLGAAPPIPIESVRRVFQELTNAEEYFRRLFKQNVASSDVSRTAAFDLRKAIELVLRGGTTASLLDNNNLTLPYERVQPTTAYADCFEYSDAALKRVSRPICTLDDYINFHRNGVRHGVIEAEDSVFGKGARYYTRIMDYSIGPGEQAPEIGSNGIPLEAFEFDLRDDWVALLKEYRQRVLFDLHPHKG